MRGAGGMKLDTAALTGTLDVKGGAFAVPKSARRWHDIELSIASEPTGLRIKPLALHESDRQNPDREVQISAFVSLEKFKPQRISLALTAKDWLLSGAPLLGMHDARVRRGRSTSASRSTSPRRCSRSMRR